MGLCYTWVNWTKKEYLDPGEQPLNENAKRPYGPGAAHTLFLLFSYGYWAPGDCIGLHRDTDDDPWMEDNDNPDTDYQQPRSDWASIFTRHPEIKRIIEQEYLQ